MKKTSLLALFFLILCGPLLGQEPEASVEVEELPCLEVNQNGAVRARVTGDIPGGELRLYFRRLHEEVEDFYWLRMHPSGAGDYWTVLPRPVDEELEERELEELEEEVEERWALWWREKEIQADRDPNDDLDTERIEERASLGRLQPRDWMLELDDATLQDWLEELEYEPVEYLAALYDGFGNQVVRSPLEVVQVRDSCSEATPLNDRERGLAGNLTVGETAEWQKGELPFHWACDGLVTRIDPFGVFRGDGACRACVVAWWKRAAFLVPLATVTAVGTGVILLDEDEDASPFQP